MSVSAPARPTLSDVPTNRPEPEALIEEARERARRRRQRNTGAALLALVGFFAVYLGIVHRGGANTSRAPSASQPSALQRLAGKEPLTIFTAAGADGIATIETAGRGRPRILWRCVGGYWCGEPVSSAWAPDGERLALSLNEIARNDSYPLALHVINLRTGGDVRIPGIRTASRDESLTTLGCWPPTELAWSPDGTRLAYRCGSFAAGLPDDRIDVLNLNPPSYRHTRFRVLATHGRAFWPSWSPDGTRIAYSTAHGLTRGARIYTIGLDGSQRRLLAIDATAPAWSPDGRRIAYESRCGLRLVTPTGRDVTPGGAERCKSIGPRGLPSWSPDGKKIAIETSRGIYVVDPDGSHLRRLTRKTSSILELGEQTHVERPSWRR